LQQDEEGQEGQEGCPPTPMDSMVTTNVQVFPEVSSNPVCESAEPLFLKENLKVFPNSPSIINLKHPCAPYFKALIDDDEGYSNDPSLDTY
jgi:hypothetical protein